MSIGSSCIQNRIENEEEYLESCPELSGVFESHIFLTPLNPSETEVEQYKIITREINEERKRKGDLNMPLKACHLMLDFRKAGYVGVMQSSRYIRCGSLKEAVGMCNDDANQYAAKFVEKGLSTTFAVIREKLECMATTTKGVPQTDEEALKYPTKYFEFHIRVKQKNKNSSTSGTDQKDNNNNHTSVSSDELKELTQISETFTNVFKTPVPISYNQTNEKQRYLNVRFRNVGALAALACVEQIEKAIKESEHFDWVKTISEYIGYDSYVQLDQGWIE